MDNDTVREALLWGKGAIIGGAAGVVGYLFQVIQRGLALRWPVFVLYVVIASGLGLSIVDVWPIDEVTHKPLPGMGAVIALLGGGAFAVYGAAQDALPALVQRVIDWLGSKLK